MWEITPSTGSPYTPSLHTPPPRERWYCCWWCVCVGGGGLGAPAVYATVCLFGEHQKTFWCPKCFTCLDTICSHWDLPVPPPPHLLLLLQPTLSPAPGICAHLPLQPLYSCCFLCWASSAPPAPLPNLFYSTTKSSACPLQLPVSSRAPSKSSYFSSRPSITLSSFSSSSSFPCSSPYSCWLHSIQSAICRWQHMSAQPGRRKGWSSGRGGQREGVGGQHLQGAPPLLSWGGGACLSTHLADSRLLELVLGLDQLRQEEGPLGQQGVVLQAGLLLKQPHNVVVVLHPDTDRHRGAIGTALFQSHYFWKWFYDFIFFFEITCRQQPVNEMHYIFFDMLLGLEFKPI